MKNQRLKVLANEWLWLARLNRKFQEGTAKPHRAEIEKWDDDGRATTEWSEK
jgi:hypothetical protein